MQVSMSAAVWRNKGNLGTRSPAVNVGSGNDLINRVQMPELRNIVNKDLAEYQSSATHPPKRGTSGCVIYGTTKTDS
jgi:hypothetical protein